VNLKPNSDFVKLVLLSRWCLFKLDYMDIFTAERPFDLPSEPRTGLSVNLNPDLTIEYLLSSQFISLVN